MKKVLIISVLVVITMFAASPLIALTPSPAPASDRYAACDLCGYCPPNEPPGNWEACRSCLYPDAGSDPSSMDTLKIDPLTNLPAAQAAGRQFTFLGCLATGNGSFQDEGAGSVVQVMLKTVFSIVGGMAFLYLLYGSFVIASSQNNPEKLNYGRRIIYGAIAGLIFSLTSIMLVNLIAGQILRIPGFGDSSP